MSGKNAKRDSLVSVILPVHNGADYLRQAIESLLNQSFKLFEILVIDDGSTDHSGAVAESFGDKRIRLLRLAEKSGICRALIHGIEKANGDFIARMDADDICHPRRLERQVKLLLKNPDVGFCGSWVHRFDSSGRSSIIDKKPVSSGRIRSYTLYDNPIVHSSVMMRKTLLDKVVPAYREEFRHAEDYDLWSRLLEFTDGYNLPEVLLRYRVHNASVTMEKGSAMDEVAERVSARELQHLGISPSSEEIKHHRRWATARFNDEDIAEDIKRAEKWFLKIYAANKDAGYVDQDDLLWSTRKVWFALVYQALIRGYAVLGLYLKSELSRFDYEHLPIMMAASAKRKLCASRT